MKRSYACAWVFLCWASVSIIAAGCHEDPAAVRPTDEESFLSKDLQSNCYSWPEQEFSPQNVAALEAALAVGSKAVEFSLADLDGNVRRLSELLRSKPVLLVLGAYT
ncbi:MAG: hypothetical protein OEX18_15550 [Candidatus Krumholzibacteria bacterium]|nr:hypothetical protein [Candidatus Krumholzibacteria bacterium]MDH4338679.1 hypothetical protein [Candidatus Krumholzibacteria bacterium]MDH5271365.1 hypothetical protein [Candidatus Krumholzibacteria bacterium]MDH5627237.1 hypothetical protein [Candidatus Krumholzibacteria bacterium]